MSESSSPISQLSQELIDKIIEELFELFASTDQKSRWFQLSSCALVCRSFLPRSQMHLFSRIKIPASLMLGSAKNRAKRCQSLYKILKRSPHIAGYIREVDVTVSKHDNSWIFEDPTFLAIMRRIKKTEVPLHKLCLKGSLNDRQSRDTYGLIKHFIKPFISPFIVSLQLCHTENFPIDALRSCVNLTELILLHVDLTASTTQTPNDIRPRVRKLDYCLSRPAMAKILRPINGFRPCLDFSDLRCLTIETDDFKDLDFEQEIIDGTGGSLERLTIGKSEREDSQFKGFVNLQHATCLRSLETYTHHNVEGNNLSVICNILATIPKSNFLEAFQLNVYLGVISDSPDVLLEADWGRFFSEMTRLATGKRFNLSILVAYEIEDTEDTTKYPRDWDSALRRIVDSDSEEEEAWMKHCEAKSKEERRRIGESKAECQRLFLNLLAENFGISNSDSGITVVFDMIVTIHEIGGR